MILLELTPQMLASDTPPNRLEQAKRKLLDLLQARRDAQTAIVVFAGSAHPLVLLSDALAPSRNLLESRYQGVGTAGEHDDGGLRIAAGRGAGGGRAVWAVPAGGGGGAGGGRGGRAEGPARGRSGVGGGRDRDRR